MVGVFDSVQPHNQLMALAMKHLILCCGILVSFHCAHAAIDIVGGVIIITDADDLEVTQTATLEPSPYMFDPPDVQRLQSFIQSHAHTLSRTREYDRPGHRFPHLQVNYFSSSYYISIRATGTVQLVRKFYEGVFDELLTIAGQGLGRVPRTLPATSMYFDFVQQRDRVLAEINQDRWHNTQQSACAEFFEI